MATETLVDPSLGNTRHRRKPWVRGTRRTGFTLIELLVVIAIIGVLVSLLLPAVQAAREQARRTTCMNNLKQIGLALAAYTDLHGALPPGYLSSWDRFSLQDTGPGWGWPTMILPQLEQQPMFNQIRFDTKISDPSQVTVCSTPLSVFFCPSDNMAPTWMATSGETWVYGGKIYSVTTPICNVPGSNYVGMFGIGEPGVDGDGVFFRNSAVAYRDITDGLSSTISVGERSTNLNLGRGQATWVGSVPLADFWSCAPNPFDTDGGGVCVHEDGSGMVLGHTGEGHGPGDPYGDVNQFLGRHGRGAYFLYCDGHAGFLKGTIYYPIYKALSTRAGGEVVPNEY